MSDSSRKSLNTIKESASRHSDGMKPRKKFVFTSYISDPQLIRRVDKYLEEKMEVDLIDKEMMVEDLRTQYKEYGRRNRAAFRLAVFKAYEIVIQANLDGEGDAEVDVENSSDESEEFIYDTEDISNDSTLMKDEMPPTKKNNGAVNYMSQIQRMTNCLKNNSNNSGQELINISSDDDEDEEVNINVGLPMNKPSYKQSALGPNIEIQMPKITLPPGTKLIGPKMPLEAGGGGHGRKRKALDLPSGNSMLKKQRFQTCPTSVLKFKDFGGHTNVLKSVTQLILHMKHPEIFRTLGVSPPRGFLLHGPPGSGKTLLAHVIAGELRVPLIKVAGPELVAGVSGESELRIRELFDQATAQAPCVLFIDEVDAITPHRETAQKDMERRIVAQLLSSLDELSRKEECDQVLVIGATNRPDSVDPAMRRAGRFDREVCLGIPDLPARLSILELLCSKLRLSADLSLKKIAQLTPGYVGADLKSLISEAAVAAVNRIMAENQTKKQSKEANSKRVAATTVVQENGETEQKEEAPEGMEIDGQKTDEIEEIPVERETNLADSSRKEPPSSTTADEVSTTTEPESILNLGPPLTKEQLERLSIEMGDFLAALKTVQPSAKREGFATVPDVTWDDIGSLHDIRDQLQMSIMMPVKYPDEFAKLGVTSPTGILLCGPPGCGKTLLAKAVANEANINFISVKGPELLNMYVGESERAVRQCFQRARNSHPCVIFFDELDALCPKRSDSIEGSASSRVVNQLLTEMDGVEGRNGVFLMGATNRPDMVDPAVMRPGRFDKILYVGLPSTKDRVEILKAVTKDGTKPPMTEVDLEEIGGDPQCEGYTGADLCALMKEASVQALAEYIKSEQKSEDQLRVNRVHVTQAFAKIRPSVSEKDRKRYEALRQQYAAPGNADKSC